MGSGPVYSLLRRCWWALLPYAGWMGGDGPVPAPWHAYPLAGLWHVVDWLLRNQDRFGPNYNRDHLYVGRPRWQPWQ